MRLRSVKLKVVYHFLIILLLCSPLFYTFNRGLMYNDEGYILQAAQRVVQGQLPYTDFFIAYTPGSIYITVAVFKLLGESILSGRIAALLASVISVVALYASIIKITQKKVLAILCCLIFVVWAPMHINFSWPVVYAQSAGFANLYFLTTFVKTKKINNLFLAAITTGIVALFKQNFGMAVLINDILFFYTFNKSVNLKHIYYYLLGLGLVIGTFLLWVFVTQDIRAFVHNFTYFFFYKIVVQGYDSTPFIYPGSVLKIILRSLIYFISPVLSLLAIAVSYIKNKKQYSFLAIYNLLFYIFGIRPVTDYVHLVSLLALIGLPIIVLLLTLRNRTARAAIYLCMIILIISGFISALFFNYYRWENPILKDNYFVSEPRVKVWTDGKYLNSIKDLTKYVSAKSNPGDFIFINYFAPSLYVILDRQNPTRYIYLSPNVVDYSYQVEISKILFRKEVKLVITHAYFANSDHSYLANFIRSHFRLDKKVSDFDMWVKKN